MIDLRSDTVTQPTPAMREAMYRAEVGDDVYGEDPTVNRLERLAAERLGKEAALFLLSGTMGNLVGILSQTRRGDEVIVGEYSHIFLNEAGGAAALGGVQLFPIPTTRGTMDPATVEASIRADNVHYPRTALVCLENTANRDGGAVVSVEATNAVAEVAHRHGLRLHLDGARLFNAAVALGVPASTLVAAGGQRHLLPLQGAGLPRGLHPGRQRRPTSRKRAAGARWSGAACASPGSSPPPGSWPSNEMVDRLAEDHRNARRLAEGLARSPASPSIPAAVETNIIFLDVTGPGVDPKRFVAGPGRAGGQDRQPLRAAHPRRHPLPVPRRRTSTPSSRRPRRPSASSRPEPTPGSRRPSRRAMLPAAILSGS